MGYYPATLFNSTGLSNGADTLGFGGEVAPSSNTGTHTLTDMGSGFFAAQGYTYAAFQDYVSYTTSVNTYVTTPLGTPYPFVTNSNCYSLSVMQQNTREWMYFGGTGYNVNCPYQTQ